MKLRKFCCHPEILEAERIEDAGFLVINAKDLSSDWPSPEEILRIQEVREKIEKALLTLSPREERVVRMWMSSESQEKIAQSLGTDRDRVQQIFTKALRKLRHPSCAGTLYKHVGIS
jgi:RNA polymerase sigma factor (sigma-70 family)